jgi:hypothetical protein
MAPLFLYYSLIAGRCSAAASVPSVRFAAKRGLAGRDPNRAGASLAAMTIPSRSDSNGTATQVSTCSSFPRCETQAVKPSHLAPVE